MRSSHFEVYSQAGPESGGAALLWFEQLRTFFEQSGANLDNRGPVRVIGFRSMREYRAYRVRPAADAYYLGTADTDYIVMPSLGESEFHVAAHEYAHLVLHASGLQLPGWLSEGLAEYFSTIRVGKRGYNVGQAMPHHLQILKQRQWMKLADLLTLPADSGATQRPDGAALFYAQSWALTEMLATSREYQSRFPELIAAINSGVPSAEALWKMYGKGLDPIATEMRAWVDGAKARTIEIPVAMTPPHIAMEQTDLSPFASRLLMADLLAAAGELNRAEALYRDLARESPGNADLSAALGALALRRGDRETARRQFQLAISQKTRDARLCYRYALLADEASADIGEIRRALERALDLKPDFDDARYKLALIDSNAGNYDTAVSQLRAMKNVAPRRAYSYWSALAYALGELGRRDEAKAAAEKALTHAATPDERARAAQIAYVADTDLAVEFTRDTNGRPQLITTRIPHGSEDWNPFIEPGDRIRRADGQLRKIECSGNKVTGIAVAIGNETLSLEIPDPLHVLMRNAPPEFMCGPQAAAMVTIEYAVSAKGSNDENVLRGMEFH